MRTRRVQLNEQAEFHEKDITETKADRSECRRLKAETVEVFKSIRSQLDIFEKRVLGDYDHFEMRCDARIERLEGKGDSGAPKTKSEGDADSETATQPPTGGAEVHELNRGKKASGS